MYMYMFLHPFIQYGPVCFIRMGPNSRSRTRFEPLGARMYNFQKTPRCGPLGIRQSPQDPERAACTKCAGLFDLNGKKEKICQPCNSKRSMCSRMFAKWPPEAFKKLNPEAQLEFWQGEASTQDKIMVDIVKHVTYDRVEREANMHVGKYLPLTAYAQMGFDPDEIKAKCMDTEVHPVLGLTYRIDIHEVSAGEIRNTVEKELIELKTKRGRESQNEADGPEKKKSKKKSSRSSSSSSSSSNSAASTKDEATEAMTPAQADIQLS